MSFGKTSSGVVPPPACSADSLLASQSDRRGTVLPGAPQIMPAMAPAPRTDSVASRAVGNTAVRASMEVATKLLSLGVFAILARTVSARAFGDYVAAMVLTAAVETLSTFGLQAMLARDIARDHSVMASLFDFIGLRLTLALTNLVALTGVVAVVGGSQRLVTLVAIFAATNAVGAVPGCVNAVFQARERMSLYALGAFPGRGLASVLAIGVLIVGGNVQQVAGVQLLASVPAAAYVLWLVHRHFPAPRFALAPRGWFGLIRRSLPMAAQELIGETIFRIDAVILTALTSTVVVGIYGASYRLLESTLFLAWSVGASVLPMFSYLTADSEPSLGRALEGVLKALLALMLPVSIAMFVFARPIVSLVYGLPEFNPSVSVLQWLAFAIVAYSIGNLTTTLVMLTQPGRRAVTAWGSVAVFNIILNFVLIPTYGARGAAAATLVTELVGAAIGLWLAQRVAGRPRLRRMLGPVAAGALMAAAAVPLSHSLLIGLPVALAVYLVVLTAVEHRVAPDDLDFVKGLLLRRRGVTAPAG
jgi:O-antigen/teichoic acid export membrane protein